MVRWRKLWQAILLKLNYYWYEIQFNEIHSWSIELFEFKCKRKKRYCNKIWFYCAKLLTHFNCICHILFMILYRLDVQQYLFNISTVSMLLLIKLQWRDIMIVWDLTNYNLCIWFQCHITKMFDYLIVSSVDGIISIQLYFLKIYAVYFFPSFGWTWTICAEAMSMELVERFIYFFFFFFWNFNRDIGFLPAKFHELEDETVKKNKRMCRDGMK